MLDALPCHVSNVKESVDTVEVKEDAEIGDVLDCASTDISFSNVFQELCFAGNSFIFKKLASRDDDIFALCIDLEDFKVVGLTDELIEVFNALVVDLGAGEEGLHTDIEHQAAFNFADNFPSDDRAFFTVVNDIFPLSLSACFFA